MISSEKRLVFSVITATRNDLSGLKTVFNSLSEQVFQSFEWIVIDGDSSDNSVPFLNEIRKTPFGIRWVSEPDRGIADAWNKGIKLSSGEHILFLNAGDTYFSYTLKEFAKVVRTDRITSSHAFLKDESGRHVGLLRAKPKSLWRGMHIPHNWASVPRNFYRQFGSYREIPYAMDYDWFLRVYKKIGANGFDVLDKALGEYHLGGISDQKFVESFSANARVMKENGMNSMLAELITTAYRFKHSAVRQIIRAQSS